MGRPFDASAGGAPGALIVTADDYGYAREFDRGILEAASAGAVDAVSAMVGRPGCEPEPLLATGVEVGLHLELAAESTKSSEHGRSAAVTALHEQLARFDELFATAPAYLDGHHHCHTCPPEVAAALAEAAGQLGLPMRSIDPEHRRLLRRARVPTPDLLVGRQTPQEPLLPAELRAAVDGDGGLPSGVTEWMVHPGYADAAAGSSYDRAREDDLDLLLGLSRVPALQAARTTHQEALV
jgi:chitin disaccharide deacetylase